MADYKTRLTADTSQHDQALKKSAQQVYQYKKKTEEAKVTLGKLAGKFGPLAAQIGIAGGAFAVLKKTITSTEAGSDAFNRTLHIGKKTVESFFQSISTGNFDSFITGLKNIKKTAEEAYNALDDLGTITNYNNAAVAELQAKIEQQRTIALNPKSSNEQKRAAEKLIRQYEQQIRDLNGEILKAGEKAASKLINELAKNPSLRQSDIEDWLNMKAHGTLADYIKNYKAENSRDITHNGVSAGNNRFAGPTSYSWTETRWESGTKEIYDAMQAVLAASEEEGNAYAQWLQVRTANSLRIIQQERENQRNNKLAAKVDKLEATPKYEKGSIADIEKQIQDLQARLRNEVLNGAEINAINKQIEALTAKKEALESLGKPIEKLKRLEAPLEEPVILQLDNSQFLEALQETIDKIEETGTTWDDLERLEGMGDVFDGIGDSISNLGGIFDEQTQNTFSGLGQIVSGIGSVLPKIAALIAAEEGEAMASGLAGAAKVEPYPAKVAAIVAIVAQILGVIGSIASIAKFADGGIIGGATSIGDYNLARVNSGEMILNNRQQQKLFNMLNNPTISTTSTDNGNVTFTIHGSDLQGTLSNYNKRVNRVK